MAQVYVETYKKNPGGSITFTETPVGLTTASGTPGTGLASPTEEIGAVRRVTLTIANLVIPITDDGVAGGHGNAAIYTFPKGLTQIFGGTADCTIAGDAGLTATSAVVMAVGTAPAAVDNATLTLTEADIIPSTACTLSSSAGAFSAATATAPALFDGRTTAKIAYLNVATPDAGITAPANLTVNGTITIAWMVT